MSNLTQQTFLGGVPLERLYTTKPTSADQINTGQKQRTKKKGRTRIQGKKKNPSNLVARSIAEQYGPQSGEEIVAAATRFMTDLGRFSNIDVNDRLMREIEGVVALLVTISDCQSFVGISAAIFGYCRSHMSTSVTSQVVTYLDELFTEQSGSEEDKEPDWIVMMRNVRTNWQLVKGNRLFSEMSKLLGLLVTFRLCSVTDVTYTVKDYKLIEPDMQIVHGNALDVIDAAFGTVMFFVENIYESCQTHSLMPFLVSDKTATEMEENTRKSSCGGI